MTAPAAAVDHEDGTRTYPVPVDGTGEIVDLGNITGAISAIDPKHICDWKQKMAILGAALRDDLRFKIAAANLLPAGPARNSELRKLLAEALTAGQIIEKGHVPADAGTGKHSLTERLDELVPPGAVDMVDELGLPRDIADIARAYVDAMAGVECLLTEVTVYSHRHGYAGTADRIIRFKPLDAWQEAFDQYDLGRGCFAFDAKFGKVHDTVALQLAAIVGADGTWNAHTQTKAPLPADLRTDLGFVFNPDKGLVPVDLTGAFDAFLGAVAIRRWQCKESPAAPEAEDAEVQATSVSYRAGITAPVPVEPHPFDDPVHISEALPKVIARIPDDPFGGLPDDDGKPQIDRQAKRAWLIERLTTLAGIDGGLDQVTARWPTVDGDPVPTFKQSTDHTADQLAAIEKAITAAEAEVWAPLRGDDPTDPRIHVVANDDGRVLDLRRRLANLPPDLQERMAAGMRASKVPSLVTGRLTEAHLQAIEPNLADAELEAEPRAKRIGELFGLAAEAGFSEAALLDVLGADTAKHLHGPLIDRLDMLVDAVRLDGIFAERDGVLVVDQPAAVLAKYGDSRQRVRDAGRTAAKAHDIDSPASADAVLAHPLLVAALVVT